MAYQLVTVEHGVSAERLAPYRRDTATLAEAVELYEWNAAVSAALWLDIGHCEVLVRNAMHAQLTAWSTRVYSQPRWYLNPGRVLHVVGDAAGIASGQSEIGGMDDQVSLRPTSQVKVLSISKPCFR